MLVFFYTFKVPCARAQSAVKVRGREYPFRVAEAQEEIETPLEVGFEYVCK